MTIEDTLNSSEATDDKSPLPTNATDSPLDNQNAEDMDKDAAAETDEEKAERLRNEAKMWEGRAKKARKDAEEKSKPLSEAEVDWRIDNKSRISLVKDAYEKELKDLEELGVKMTLAARSKALENAEARGLPRNSPNSDSSLPSPTVDRSATAPIKLSEFDRATAKDHKVRAETIKEYRDYVEGR